MQAEVQLLKQRRIIKELVNLPDGNIFGYTLRMDTRFDAYYRIGELGVSIPEKEALAWMDAEELSLRHTLVSKNQSQLSLLIEKDLKCMVEREGEDESDAFPNPNPITC